MITSLMDLMVVDGLSFDASSMWGQRQEMYGDAQMRVVGGDGGGDSQELLL